MDYRELDTNDYEVAIGEKTPEGIQQITITVKRDAPFCEECLSVDAVKKCVATRKVLDVVDKQPVQYTINRYRYRCPECGHTYAPDYLYDPKVRVAPEFSKFLAQKVLQDNLSEEQAAKKYGVSTTYVSEAIHAYEQEFEEEILSITPCPILAFYPFEYSSRTRCCVIGTTQYGQNVLLGILPDCSSNTIVHFIREKVKNAEDLKIVYCDLKPDVFRSLRAEFPSAYVLIMHERLIHHCNKLNKDTGDGLFNEKNNHIKRFNAIVKSVGTSPEQLCDALENWWRETPEDIKSYFLPLWNQIKECLDGCLNPKMHDGTKSGITAMLDIIKGFRKNNVHFDIMILKTWFKDEAVIKRVKQTPFGNHMSMAYCFSYDEGDYGVDIEKLKRIYLK